MSFLESAKKNWFLISIAVFIIFARIAPWIGQKGGPLYPEVTIKYIAVSVIFFNSGLSLRTEDLKAAIFHYRLHLFIQSFTFIFIPTAISALVKSLQLTTNLHNMLLRGILVVACMPPPVSSAVILTKAIGGNDAGAIFNSALGSFLGIFITPVLLLLLVGVSGSVPVMNIVNTLSVTVVMPLIVGQLVRTQIKDWLDKTKPPLSQIGSFMLLMIIYTTFCDTFSKDVSAVKPTELVIVVILIIFMQLGFLYLIFTTTGLNSSGFGYTKSDAVALMFCSTHKSLTLGMPILKIIYAGDVALTFISIPLLIYHPTQILLGGFLVPVIKKWLVDTTTGTNNV